MDAPVWQVANESLAKWAQTFQDLTKLPGHVYLETAGTTLRRISKLGAIVQIPKLLSALQFVVTWYDNAGVLS